jgi:hypothetical protein
VCVTPPLYVWKNDDLGDFISPIEKSSMM